MNFVRAFLCSSKLLLSVLMLIVCSCDNSSDDITEIERPKNIPITVYNGSYNNHSQVNISEDGNVTTTILDDELQLNPSSNYSSILSKELVTFYSLLEDNLGIKQKNLVTGSTIILQDFCPKESTETFEKLTSNGNVFARLSKDITADGESVHLDLYNEQQGLPCSRIDIINSSVLDEGFHLIDVEAYDDHILIRYTESDFNTYYLTVVDLTSNQIVHEFAFDYIWAAFILGDDIYISSTYTNQYQVYGMSNFALKRDLILPEGTQIGFGLIHPNVYQNQIVAKTPMIQPSFYEYLPRIVDLENGELLSEMNLTNINRLDNEAIGEIIENFEFDFIRSFERYAIDMKSETIVFAYRVSDTSGVIVFADYSGNILSYVPVPVNPYRIILH